MAESFLSFFLSSSRFLRRQARAGAAPFPLGRLVAYLVCAGLLLNAWLPDSW